MYGLKPVPFKKLAFKDVLFELTDYAAMGRGFRV
jgi:hypothetical protein